MTRVLIAPDWYDVQDSGQGGIKRVWEAMVRYLPQFGIEIVRNPEDADVICTHGAQLKLKDGREIAALGKPIVNVNHGLYWSRYQWGDNYKQVNKEVVEAMRCAVAHTAPSEWVATSLRRGMLIYPEVVYHGVDADEWTVPPPDKVQPYVLWNKARADFVSNPNDMNELAKRMPHRPFVSTKGQKTPNVHIIGGDMPFEQMKQHIAHASVYLSTARETFGIGTLEALACGVPVAGWDWGGNSEIIKQGETGYLAKPGDYDELARCVERCYEERERLSANARRDIVERWGWEPRIKQYGDIYKRVHRYYSSPRPKVSVIITAYNLDRYIGQSIRSVQDQTVKDIEILVVDDALSDTTKELVAQHKDERIKYLRPPQNLGLPGARNFGFDHSKGQYIRHLDADDWLAPNALELELTPLEKNSGLHISYGVLQNVNEDGTERVDGNGKPERWPETKQFSWRQQMAHVNQIPSTCMVRREVFDRSGGYRVRMKKAEDAHFWCLVTSLGFKAVKACDAVVMYHRIREDSKGMQEWKHQGGDGDWTAWFPWRMGASNYGEGIATASKFGRNVPNPRLVPFGAQGEAPPNMHFWDAHDYSYPTVSIVVTCGPGHEKYLQDALDSIASQTYPDWECVVVNDTGKEWSQRYWNSPLRGFPWAKYVSTGGNLGVSNARNLGAQYTKAPAIVWLDGDDYWLPWFLEKMVGTHEQNNGIIYSDLLWLQDGALTEKNYPEFDSRKLVSRGLYPGSSTLVPRWVHDVVVDKQGGYDTEIPGMEDWDYQFAAHAYTGACAYRVEEPLFVYRVLPDGNREKHKKVGDLIAEYMNEKWKPYRLGGQEIVCGCKAKKASSSASSKFSASGASPPPAAAQQGAEPQAPWVMLEYVGKTSQPHSIRGPVTGRPYRFGLDRGHKVKRVDPDDARELLAIMKAHGKDFILYEDESQPVAPRMKEFLGVA